MTQFRAQPGQCAPQGEAHLPGLLYDEQHQPGLLTTATAWKLLPAAQAAGQHLAVQGNTIFTLSSDLTRLESIFTLDDALPPGERWNVTRLPGPLCSEQDAGSVGETLSIQGALYLIVRTQRENHPDKVFGGVRGRWDGNTILAASGCILGPVSDLRYRLERVNDSG